MQIVSVGAILNSVYVYQCLISTKVIASLLKQIYFSFSIRPTFKRIKCSFFRAVIQCFQKYSCDVFKIEKWQARIKNPPPSNAGEILMVQPPGSLNAARKSIISRCYLSVLYF